MRLACFHQYNWQNKGTLAVSQLLNRKLSLNIAAFSEMKIRAPRNHCICWCKRQKIISAAWSYVFPPFCSNTRFQQVTGWENEMNFSVGEEKRESRARPWSGVFVWCSHLMWALTLAHEPSSDCSQCPLILTPGFTLKTIFNLPLNTKNDHRWMIWKCTHLYSCFTQI